MVVGGWVRPARPRPLNIRSYGCRPIVGPINSINGADNHPACLIAALYEQCRCGPADVVVVSADGLIAVPTFLHSPSAPLSPPATESMGATYG